MSKINIKVPVGISVVAPIIIIGDHTNRYGINQPYNAYGTTIENNKTTDNTSWHIEIDMAYGTKPITGVSVSDFIKNNPVGGTQYGTGGSSGIATGDGALPTPEGYRETFNEE